jgi:3-deoxy-D-manno-octulosonate 8-phosphate phosphatase (KDO 8-P phosphatase)
LSKLPVKLISLKLRNKAKRINLLLLDVDGVLTDGGIFIDDHGYETKRFDVRDGQGIVLLRRVGVEVGFISGRSSGVVGHRAKELGVRMVYQNVQSKAEIYNRIKQKSRLKDAQIAYVGDDVPDLPILRKVGLAMTVRDASPAVKGAVHYVTEARGGRGAVREISELLLTAQRRWKDLPNRRSKR